jgi:hypothetical protein
MSSSSSLHKTKEKVEKITDYGVEVKLAASNFHLTVHLGDSIELIDSLYFPFNAKRAKQKYRRLKHSTKSETKSSADHIAKIKQ